MEKPAKVCKYGFFDLDHTITRIHGMYRCMNRNDEVCWSQDFKPVSKEELKEWKAKYQLLKIQGVLV